MVLLLSFFWLLVDLIGDGTGKASPVHFASSLNALPPNRATHNYKVATLFALRKYDFRLIAQSVGTCTQLLLCTLLVCYTFSRCVVLLIVRPSFNGCKIGLERIGCISFAAYENRRYCLLTRLRCVQSFTTQLYMQRTCTNPIVRTVPFRARSARALFTLMPLPIIRDAYTLFGSGRV